MSDFQVTYSQNREDIIIAGFFPDVTAGHYIDVGAYHPTYDSVTKRFYQHGWSGTHVEPNRAMSALLKADRPRDIILECAVSNKSGNMTYRLYKNAGLSTVSKEIIESYVNTQSKHTHEYKEYEVKVITLADVFKDSKQSHVHFLKIDVEGHEYAALESNDWTRYRPELICIEADHIIKDWHPILKKANYILVFNDGLNEYYLRQESIHRKEQFSYVQSMLLSGEIVSWSQAVRLSDLHRTNLKLNYDLSLMKKELESTRNLIQLQVNNGTIKHELKDLLRAVDRSIVWRLSKEPGKVSSLAAEDISSAVRRELEREKAEVTLLKSYIALKKGLKLLLRSRA